jgi:hypothetical protein
MRKSFLYLVPKADLKYDFSLPCHIRVDYMTQKIFGTIENKMIEMHMSPTVFQAVKNHISVMRDIELAMHNNAESVWSVSKQKISAA